MRTKVFFGSAKLQIAALAFFFCTAFSFCTFSGAERGENSGLKSCILKPSPDWKVGAENLEEYLGRIQGKKVGVVAHQSSLVGDKHLVDTLLDLKVDIVRIFSPEHGFRGVADAGELVADDRDPQTGLEIISLYGSNKKPRSEQMDGLEIMIFDLQDVGVRFYTYINTLFYVMEACAEKGIPLIVLDRPNPNAHRVGGPVLDTANFKSFVGMFPIPILYGLTIGELATMMVGEGWMPLNLDLQVVFAPGFKRGMTFELSPPPSPNLPNLNSILLYPSLCFFEGTPVVVGRGTDYPFQFYGHPSFEGDTTLVPQSKPGATKPRFKNENVPGWLLEYEGENGINYAYLLNAYRSWENEKADFFVPFFHLLAGTDSLADMLRLGWDEAQIVDALSNDLESYDRKRKKYLYYSNFRPE